MRNIERHGPQYYFKDEKYHLVGDSAFPLKTWLMTPFKDNQMFNKLKRHHNHVLSSERVVIEHAFGQLKGRWRRLKHIQTYNINKSIEISIAACILHNFCIKINDLWNNEIDTETPINEMHHQHFNDNFLSIAKMKRNRIASELYVGIRN